MLLKNKTIIITGAGAGLGSAIARICHREGANVVISDVRKAGADEVANNLATRAVSVECDVRRDEHLRGVVRSAVEVFGRIDGLVNNAGVNFVKPFLTTTPADWDRVINVDLRPAFFLTQFVCEQMLKQEPRTGGSIVNISSVHSMAVLPGSGPYDAAKFGVVGLAKSIAVEMAPFDIRVNILSPGLLNTQIWQTILDAAPSHQACIDYFKANIPIGRVIEPEEIGEIAAFLLSDRSKCMTGSNVLADGGMTSQLISKEPYVSRPIGGEGKR